MRKVLSTKKIEASLVAMAYESGIEISEVEMITIKYIENTTLNNDLSAAVTPLIVFTSKNAVRAVAGTLGKSAIDQLAKVYCMEGATAIEFSEWTGQDPAGTARDAASLAALIINHETPQRITFFCGNRRRDELPAKLKVAGYEVREIEVYETIPTPKKVDGTFDGVMFFSPSAVESFFSVNNIAPEVVCFSVGNTTTIALEKYTSTLILTAARPSETEVLRLLTGKWTKEL